MRGIFLGLGSNCGECSRLLRDALVLLEEKGVVAVAKSSIYETEAVGVRADGVCGVAADVRDAANAAKNYLNAVVEVETDLNVRELLRACDEVERALGRVRGGGEVRWGARTIDIDILLYGEEVVGWGASVPGDTLDELVVPHPRMHERNFVLVPLVEAVGESSALGDVRAVMHPVFEISIVELLRRSKDTHKVFVSPEKW